jgi:myb proto-oncogene protein
MSATAHSNRVAIKPSATSTASTEPTTGSPNTPKTDAVTSSTAPHPKSSSISMPALPKPSTTTNATKKANKPKKAKNRKRSQKARWTGEEDKLLRSLVKANDAKNWKKISESFPERTDVQCLHRWQKVLNPNLIKVRVW